MLNNIKKHAMALAALTIAIGSLTLMSFKAEDPLFWYEIDVSANEIGAQVSASQMTKTQVLASPSNPGCNDAGTEVCLAGFPTPKNEGDPYSTPSSADHRINKNN